MTEQVLKVLGKLDKRNTRSIIWVTLEQAKLIKYSTKFDAQTGEIGENTLP